MKDWFDYKTMNFRDFLFYNLQKMFRLIKKFKAFFIIFLLIFFFASVYWQYVEEKAVVPEISFYDVLENSTLVVLGEYPDKPPTFKVRVFRLFLFIIGILLFGYIVGSVSSVLVVERMLTEKISTKFKGHIVICNWNKNGDQVLSQISKICQKDIQVAILSSHCSKDIENQSRKNLLITVYNNLDPTHYQDLEKINITEATAVILLTDEGCENPDGKNVLIALAIKCIEESNNKNVFNCVYKIIKKDIIDELSDDDKSTLHNAETLNKICLNTECECNDLKRKSIIGNISNNLSEVGKNLVQKSFEANDKKITKKVLNFMDIHVVAEISNLNMTEHLNQAGADEAISNNVLISGILAQTSIFQGIAEIYKRLLNYSDSTNEIYFIKDFSEEFKNADSFIELSQMVSLSTDKKENPVLLLGIKNDTNIVLNPKKSAFVPVIKGADELIVMAYKEVKKLTFNEGVTNKNSNINKHFQTIFCGEKSNETSTDECIIICNWNKHGKRIVNEIQKMNPKIKIIAPNCDYSAKEKKNSVEIENKNPTKTLLKNVLASQPVKSVLLLANQKSSNPDAENALIALAINQIDKNIRITAELTDPKMKHNLLKAGVDEIVCNHTFIGGMIAQTALNKGMSHVYNRLLECNNKSNEIYFISEFPNEFTKIESFAELAEEVAIGAPEELPLILIGIKYAGYDKNKSILLNPQKQEFKPITKDDQLIVMSYRKIQKITADKSMI